MTPDIWAYHRAACDEEEWFPVVLKGFDGPALCECGEYKAQWTAGECCYCLVCVLEFFSGGYVITNAPADLVLTEDPWY